MTSPGRGRFYQPAVPPPPPSGKPLDYPAGTGPSDLLVQGMPDGSEVVRPLALFNNPFGNTDDAAIINDSLARCGFTRLIPGYPYSIYSPIVITANNQRLAGAGQRATSIVCKATSAITAMLEVGPSAVLQNVTLAGFQLFGNANSGHNLIWRSIQGSARDLILQSPQSDCLHIDPASLSGAPSIFQCVFENIQGIHPGGNGLYTDKINDSDFIACTFDGGTSGDTVPGGNIGMNVTGGSNNRFHGCHAYLFAQGGASITGSDHVLLGGELESNGVADLILNNVHHGAAIGVALYDRANSTPPSQHIWATGGTSRFDISSCIQGVETYTVPNFITMDAGSTVTAHDCPGYNPVGSVTAPTFTAGTATTNSFPVRMRVYVTGTTAVAINGTATGLASGSFTLAPGDTITPTGAGSWTWFGE